MMVSMRVTGILLMFGLLANRWAKRSMALYRRLCEAGGELSFPVPCVVIWALLFVQHGF